MLLIPKRVKELKDEARKETDAEWEAWLKRRDKAKAANEPFGEPPPSRRE